MSQKQSPLAFRLEFFNLKPETLNLEPFFDFRLQTRDS
jgi:hypothetical protein